MVNEKIKTKNVSVSAADHVARKKNEANLHVREEFVPSKNTFQLTIFNFFQLTISNKLNLFFRSKEREREQRDQRSPETKPQDRSREKPRSDRDRKK